MLQKKIASIDFRVLDPKTTRKMSAIEIKTADTYDRDGYPMEEGLMDAHLGVINPGLRCKTCGLTMKDCPGHFGSFEMVRPVIHAKFSKKIEEVLSGTCYSCGRVPISDEDVANLKEKLYDSDTLIKKVRAKAIKARKCPHCKRSLAKKVLLDRPTNFYVGEDRIYPNEIRDWLERISDSDLELFGFNTERVRPEWMIITVLPVPPINIRPSITLEMGVKSEDDLTHKLVDIIRINERLKDNIDAGAPQLIIEDLWDLLQYHVTTYFDNHIAGVPPAKHRSGRPLRTLTQRLKGKKGRFRHNLTGKRVNFSARSTVSPDPYLSINEVGVPKLIAKQLTLPETVTAWNKDRLIKLIKKNPERISSITYPDGRRKRITQENIEDMLEEFDVGFKLERTLEDGDIVLFNRQPSLHRLSMLAHRVRIMDDKTLKLNPIVCKPYNADFDGDEMNMHVPQTEEGQAEARELMYVQNQVLSPRYGAPIIVLDEDGVSGSFTLTHRATVFDKKTAFRYFQDMELKRFPKPDRGQMYSGKLVFSQLLPKDLNLAYPTKISKILSKIDPNYDSSLKEKSPYDDYVVIHNGHLISGVIDESSLGEGSGGLVDTLARNYPPEALERFYYFLSRINADLLSKKGMTVGLDEYEVSENIHAARKKAVARGLKEASKLEEQFRSNKLELIPGRTLEESFEVRMIQNAMQSKEAVEAQILTEKLSDVIGERLKLNTAMMIASGSRGSSANLMNISGFWGQASVREGRPKRGFKERPIALEKKGDLGAVANGFISSNFMEGMGPKEYFFHAIGGRQGEVDTGVSTKVSGYLYRRLANSLKDLSVDADGTVRTGGKRIVQYKYGEDGIFPTHSKKGKAVDFSFEAHQLSGK